MKIVRVFPRKTSATPTDELCYFGPPPKLFPPECDVVHVSVTFTWDLPRAEWLALQWMGIAPVYIGGPATGEPGGEFSPGAYLKPGYVITSRGCPNHCWFCSVWRREGNIRELPIMDGVNVLDDNLLACSDDHIRSVFSMLKTQRGPKQFTGGLEAARLQHWHCELLADLKPKQVFFAYDTKDDLEPLYCAGEMLRQHGMKIRHPLRAYVLIGYPGDSFQNAEQRLHDTIKAGFLPAAMLYRDDYGKCTRTWKQFQRKWFRPAIMSGYLEGK